MQGENWSRLSPVRLRSHLRYVLGEVQKGSVTIFFFIIIFLFFIIEHRQ